tara:strand:- start:2 stop:466 length:465 start_codon:yes stop_codon:yes gene_type:complete
MPYHLSFATRLGFILVRSDGTNLTSLEIMEQPSASNPDAITEEAQGQISQYLAGQRKEFDLPIDLTGTTFQMKVWNELQKIPFGHSLSYEALARLIANPRAFRAVGSAVGSNPIPVIIPCHRILGKNKKITGYSAGKGIPTKRELLRGEGISFL